MGICLDVGCCGVVVVEAMLKSDAFADMTLVVAIMSLLVSLDV